MALFDDGDYEDKSLILKNPTKKDNAWETWRKQLDVQLKLKYDHQKEEKVEQRIVSLRMKRKTHEQSNLSRNAKEMWSAKEKKV